MHERREPAAAGLLEPSLLPVTRRRRLDQRHSTALAPQVEMAVRCHQRTAAHRAVVPLPRSRLEVDADQAGAVAAVEVIADPDDAAVEVADRAHQVDFLRLDVVAAGNQPQQGIASGASGAARRDEDTAVVYDRRGAAHTSDVPLVAPQEAAVAGRDAHDPAAEELDVLPDPADFRNDHRGVAGLVAAGHLRLPANAAVLLVERQQRGRFTARRADKRITIDEDRLGIGPGAAVALELLFQVMSPDDLAVGGAGADQVAVGAKGVEAVAVHRGRRARTGIAGSGVLADRPDLGGPQQPTDLDIESVKELLVALAAHEEDAATGNGRRGVTAAKVRRLPEQLRPVPGPLLEQARFGRDAGAVRSAPTRPIAGVLRLAGVQESRTVHGQQQREDLLQGDSPQAGETPIVAIASGIGNAPRTGVGNSAAESYPEQCRPALPRP